MYGVYALVCKPRWLLQISQVKYMYVHRWLYDTSGRVSVTPSRGAAHLHHPHIFFSSQMPYLDATIWGGVSSIFTIT